MEDFSGSDTEPNIKKQSAPRRRFINLDLLLGFLLGLLVSLIIGFAFWRFGFLNLPGEGCPEIPATATCPATSVAPAITTPIIKVVTATLTATPTPTATRTPDLGATATAACIAFESQFPATPCP